MKKYFNFKLYLKTSQECVSQECSRRRYFTRSAAPRYHDATSSVEFIRLILSI